MKKNRMNVGWSEFLRLSAVLAGKISGKYRTWLLIGTNGFRVGSAVCNSAGKASIRKAALACVQAKHYEGRARKKRVALSPILGRIKEPVLIIDDIIDTGDTVLAVKKKLGKVKADVAVIFKKPWSKVDTDYYVTQTDSWVVFPWERD